METTHRIHYDDARRLKGVTEGSVALVVTSPPYPMIEMWDPVFGELNPEIGKTVRRGDGAKAFELMHRELDKVWDRMYRSLKPGGIACINIGDATRTLDGHFALFANHSRIQSRLLELGFTALPAILWRKQTNAPNKFMGSGMMPPGAYVTLEHEYVLVARKGNKRPFASPAEKKNRRRSAYFWEERNLWFSDVWMDLKGTTQRLFDPRTRKRSGAFPFELPYRLISMFSVKGDTVLDPFAGVGTTTAAAMAAGRNSIGYEIDGGLREALASRLEDVAHVANARIHRRLADHCRFVEDRFRRKGPFRHRNRPYGFPVVTAQETELLIEDLISAERTGPDAFTAIHANTPQEDFAGLWDGYVQAPEKGKSAGSGRPSRKPGKDPKGQMNLFR